MIGAVLLPKKLGQPTLTVCMDGVVSSFRDVGFQWTKYKDGIFILRCPDTSLLPNGMSPDLFFSNPSYRDNEGIELLPFKCKDLKNERQSFVWDKSIHGPLNKKYLEDIANAMIASENVREDKQQKVKKRLLKRLIRVSVFVLFFDIVGVYN